MASNGLSLTDDGRVMFNSDDQLAAADTNGRRDAYEWAEEADGPASTPRLPLAAPRGPARALISAGTSTFDSSLLGVTADSNT